ncbi:MAG: acyltransferase [Cyanobacteriota bacterium]|nr:acyltransferase [Cyanobacteriota bacterium]
MAVRSSTSSNKGHLYSLDLIKALGIVLVINSHLDDVYKSPLLATGGALGNSLFFLASGVGLGYGWAHHGPQQLGTWYQRRILRIYPSLTILNIIFLLATFSSFAKQSPQEIFSFLIYPTPYFFIAAIMLFYIPGYFLLRAQSTRVLVATIFASLGVYFAWYTTLDLRNFTIEGESYFRWVFYFIVFVIGLLYARLKTTQDNPDTASAPLRGLLSTLSQHPVPALACSFGFFAISKFIFRDSTPLVMNFQFLVQFFTLMLTWYVFQVSETVACQLQRHRFAWPLVSLLSAITLELYLLDRYTDPYIRNTNELVNSLDLFFPFEFKSRLLAAAVLWVVLITLAYLLSRLSGSISKFLPSPKRAAIEQKSKAS